MLLLLLLQITALCWPVKALTGAWAQLLLRLSLLLAAGRGDCAGTK